MKTKLPQKIQGGSKDTKILYIFYSFLYNFSFSPFFCMSELLHYAILYCTINLRGSKKCCIKDVSKTFLAKYANKSFFIKHVSRSSLIKT